MMRCSGLDVMMAYNIKDSFLSRNFCGRRFRTRIELLLNKLPYSSTNLYSHLLNLSVIKMIYSSYFTCVQPTNKYATAVNKMELNILDGLNPEQSKAVTHLGGPMLILAGPGSGKTRVIVHRIAYLISVGGIEPHRIFAATFTNKSSRELRERLNVLIGGFQGEKVNAGTFHGLCARMLREEGTRIGLEPNFSIYDTNDSIAVIKQAFEMAEIDHRRFPFKAVLKAISGAKAELLDLDSYKQRVDSYFEEIVAQVYSFYQTLLERNQGVDFDDLLLRTFHLLSRSPDILDRFQTRYLHVLVDEFQDTNVAQYAIAKQLSGKWGNICVVGDPDQSIYSWRHADIRNILSFQNDFPAARLVVLEENYRSPPAILEAAHGVISANTQRLDKRLIAQKPSGEPVFVYEAYDSEDEASWVIGELERLRSRTQYHHNEFAIAYRVNAQSRVFEEACLRKGIPYKLVGALRFYQRREIKDILSYLRILSNPTDDVSLTRIINVPPRGNGRKTVDEVTRIAQSQEISLWETLNRVLDGTVDVSRIPVSGKTALLRFRATLEELKNVSSQISVHKLIDKIVSRTGYEDFVLDGENNDEKFDNIQELKRVAFEFSDLDPVFDLQAFLERVALITDQDNLNSATDGLTLITLHQAKGLEFPVVFIVGMEEGILPHVRALDNLEEMEEERRLCYVGMTRAQDRLYLVRAFRRTSRGASNIALASRFLRDIPLHVISSPTQSAQVHSSGKVSSGVLPREKIPPVTPLRDGDKVVHSLFGEGVVVNFTESGLDHEVTVAFKNAGIKRLLYSLAKLTIQE
ncbi:AAA family ATPase [SAR202 cluster bacterium AD-802-E10_MRT_200m]|nr:AAA family ATPase [SAR202 cluster bacterium AD-802-E10_MRT_200m]